MLEVSLWTRNIFLFFMSKTGLSWPKAWNTLRVWSLRSFERWSLNLITARTDILFLVIVIDCFDTTNILISSIIVTVVIVIENFLFIILISIISTRPNPSWSLWSRYYFSLYFWIEYAFIIMLCELFLILFVSIFIIRVSLFVMNTVYVTFGQTCIWVGIGQSFALFYILFVQEFSQFGGFMPD